MLIISVVNFLFSTTVCKGIIAHFQCVHKVNMWIMCGSLTFPPVRNGYGSSLGERMGLDALGTQGGVYMEKPFDANGCLLVFSFPFCGPRSLEQASGWDKPRVRCESLKAPPRVFVVMGPKISWNCDSCRDSWTI